MKMNPNSTDNPTTGKGLKFLKIVLWWYVITMVIGLTVVVPEFFYKSKLPRIHEGLAEGKLELAIPTKLSLDYINFMYNLPVIFLAITGFATFLAFKFKKNGIFGVMGFSGVLTACLSVGVLWPVK